MSQIIPSQYLLISKTLDLQQYIKYQKFTPPLHKNVKHTIEHTQKKSIRSGRTLKRSQQQRRSRLMNIGLCNLIHCTDGFVKFYTFTSKVPQFNKPEFTRDFTDFIRRFERVLGYKPLYIAVLEEHDSASTKEDRRFSYHIHALFFNVGYYHDSKIMDIWGFGIVKIKAISISEGYKGLSYVLKYLSKDTTMNDRVLMPRAMTRPVVTYNWASPTNCTLIYKHDTFISEADVTVTSCLYKK